MTAMKINLDPRTVPPFSTPQKMTQILGIDRNTLQYWARTYELHTGQLLKPKGKTGKAGARRYPREVVMKFANAINLMADHPTLGFAEALKQMDSEHHTLTGEHIGPEWAAKILRNQEEILRLLRAIDYRSSGTNDAITHILGILMP